MKVVLVASVLGIGGLPNYVLTLGRLLTASGCEVLVAYGNAPLPAHLEVDGLTMLHLPGLADEAGAREAARAVACLQTCAPDVVHVHVCSNPGVIDGLLASGLVLVRSFHDFTSLCLRRGRRRWPGDRCQRAVGLSCASWGCMISPPFPGNRLPRIASLFAKMRERDSYRDFAASVVASTYMAKTLQTNGFQAARIHVIPHFSRFEEAAQASEPTAKRPGVPGRDRPFELLFCGQAVNGKGLEILIAALRGLDGHWRLTVVSDGPRLKPAKAKVEAFGLSGRIDFLGWVPQAETLQHYRLADLFVVPSVWDDPSPLVGLEAMAFSTPLVGFAVGGIPEYLIDGQTGVLVRETTAEALRKGLARAMADPELLHAWGMEARALIASRHSRAEHEAGLRRAYEIAAGARGRPMAPAMTVSREPRVTMNPVR